MHTYLSCLPLAQHWCSQARSRIWQAVPTRSGQPLRGLRRRPRRQGHDGAGRRAPSSAALSVTSKEAEAIAGAPVAARRARKLQLEVLDLDHTLLECSTDKRASNVEASSHWQRRGRPLG